MHAGAFTMTKNDNKSEIIMKINRNNKIFLDNLSMSSIIVIEQEIIIFNIALKEPNPLKVV